jgi:hypothetical protein
MIAETEALVEMAGSLRQRRSRRQTAATGQTPVAIGQTPAALQGLLEKSLARGATVGPRALTTLLQKAMAALLQDKKQLRGGALWHLRPLRSKQKVERKVEWGPVSGWLSQSLIDTKRRPVDLPRAAPGMVGKARWRLARLAPLPL